MENTFINYITKELFEHYKNNFLNVTLILPNKRAKLFLLEALKNQSNQTFFAPKITTIETFLEEVSQIKGIDSIDLLFEFYQVYINITPNNPDNFETFSGWAKTLLQDFNDIDRYLIEPNEIFCNLLEIERIKHWNVEADNQTALVENYLQFWQKLPEYYTELQHYLLNRKIAYQGLIYKVASEKITQFANANHQVNYVFVGFNALSKAEEKVIKHLLEFNNAKIYWDIDAHFFNDPYHDAGLFLRKIKSTWKHFNSYPFTQIHNHYIGEKNIQIISTPKSVGQAKITGKIIEDLITNNQININKTAIVLSEENLLLPILNALPKQVSQLNITMGYASKNNPAQQLLSKILKMQLSAQKRNPKQNVFYYKEVLDVLTNPLLEKLLYAKEILKYINTNNVTFFTETKLLSILKETNISHKDLFISIFSSFNVSIEDTLSKLKNLLLTIKTNIQQQTQTDSITLTFVHSIYNSIIKIENYYNKHQKIENLETFYAIYKQVIANAEVSFEGKPLNGLQIMGILESRILDFENVIITSLNEGKLPGGRSNESFIPFDIKIANDIPTFKERDAVFTYHFYRLLQRAKNVYLLYNTDSEGIDAGEKSRFLTQLEIEKHPNHQLTKTEYFANLSTIKKPKQINKNPEILARLKEIATEKGFSPSALTNYLRNPMQFYLQRILSISDAEILEEEIAANTLGNIIHLVLEDLFKDFETTKKQVLSQDIELMLKKIDFLTNEKFKLTYKEGEYAHGKNLITFELAKNSLFRYLQQEKTNLENGDELFILSLEKSYQTTINHPNLPYPVNIAGKIDRIELRNNTIRIIDYKTGNVQSKDLKIATFENLTQDLKNEKIIQLLTYALMFQEQKNYQSYPLQVGIICFKNLSEQFMPIVVGKGKGVNPETEISPETIQDFSTQMVQLISEILNPNQPFIENM